MKKLIIAMSVIAFAFASCQKQAPIVSTNSTNSSNLLSSDAKHYYQGKLVTNQSEITSFMQEESITVLTDKIDGSLAYYYFDNAQQELAFLKSYPQLKPLYDKTIQAIEMREYAIKTNEINHFNQSGELSQNYINFTNQFKDRAGYRLYANLGGAGLPNIFIAGPLAIVPVPMGDNAESYRAPNTGGIVWRDAFFAGPAFAVLAAPGFVNFPVAWRNIISSAN